MAPPLCGPHHKVMMRPSRTFPNLSCKLRHLAVSNASAPLDPPPGPEASITEEPNRERHLGLRCKPSASTEVALLTAITAVSPDVAAGNACRAPLPTAGKPGEMSPAEASSAPRPVCAGEAVGAGVGGAPSVTKSFAATGCCCSGCDGSAANCLSSGEAAEAAADAGGSAAGEVSAAAVRIVAETDDSRQEGNVDRVVVSEKRGVRSGCAAAHEGRDDCNGDCAGDTGPSGGAAADFRAAATCLSRPLMDRRLVDAVATNGCGGAATTVPTGGTGTDRKVAARTPGITLSLLAAATPVAAAAKAPETCGAVELCHVVDWSLAAEAVGSKTLTPLTVLL